MNYVRRQFNFNLAGSHALHACADPEHLSEGVVREDRNATKNGPPSAHQRNAIVDNGPLLNAGLVAESGSILLGNPIFLRFFRGVRIPCPHSGSAHGIYLKEGTAKSDIPQYYM